MIALSLVAAVAFAGGLALRRATRPLPDPAATEYRDSLGRKYGQLDHEQLERLIRQGH